MTNLEYKYSGLDFMTQFTFLLTLFFVDFIAFLFFNISIVLIIQIVIFEIVLSFGFRGKIIAKTQSIHITKKWFFIPYKTYRGKELEDVYFSGDWGLEEGACSVMVDMNGKEIHLGSKKTMNELYDALIPFQMEEKYQRLTKK